MPISVPARKLYSHLLAGKRSIVPKGQVIQSSDDKQTLSLIKRGFVKRYLITSDGTLGVQNIYGPNDVFPLSNTFTILFDRDIYGGSEVYYYETMSETAIYTIDRLALLKAAHADPLLYRDLLALTGQRLHSNIQRLENLSLRVFYKRVAHQLAFYARQYGKRRLTGTKILIPLTQQDLADVLSATRETVSLSIRQLRERGLIKTGKDNIIIPNIKKLEAEAFS